MRKAADQAAVNAMRTALNGLAMDGTVVIGEGERDEAPMLYIGEKVGAGGPKIDIALDPLEGTTLTAKGGPNALAVVAMAEEGGFLNAPDTYMDKIAVGGGLPDGVIDLDASPKENLAELSKAKGTAVEDLVVCVLDRPRHAEIISQVREAGARIMLIGDGDVSGVIATSRLQSGVDIYMGTGGAPEGVLAAAALRCIGGQMQGRLVFRNDDEKARGRKWGIEDFDRKYTLHELAGGNVMFAATGVTDGSMLKGVRRFQNGATTQSMVMRSKTGHGAHCRCGTQFQPQDLVRQPGRLGSYFQTMPDPSAEREFVPPLVFGCGAQSVTGKRWEDRLPDSRLGLALAQRCSAPEVVGRIMAGRGVTLEQIDSFLNPTLKVALPDPSHLQDMESAVERLVAAVEKGEKIAVFGDYDVDGATSSALLARFFRAAGIDIRVYIPDRMAEGYGPNEAALRRLREEGASVVITVDCGITAFEPLAAAAECGLDVIVVDHHAAEPRLPRAAAVINPNRLDDDSPHGQLAAVGVTFLLIVALNRALRGWYSTQGREEPDLRQWLDLVALGTVCDVVPLTGLNRAYVAQGLKVMARRGNAGLAALCDVGNISEPPGTFHAGFVLGPRVNAGGRVGEAPLGARLLASDSARESAEIARRLDAYNAERKEIEAAVLDQAIDQIEKEGSAGRSLAFAVSEGWHAGVIGIVASRLKERYNRPALVIALENGIGKGSGRSVPGVDFGSAVIASRQSDILINGGGHPMAAGLTVAEGSIGALRDFLEDNLGRQLAAIDYQPSLGVDGALQAGGANADLLRQIEACGPFGVGNTTPRFVLPAARIAKASVVGSNHVRCFVTGADGGRIKAIAFRALDNPLGEALLKSGNLPLHLAGKLQWDTWSGPEAVQFFIDDAAAIPG